MKRTLVFLKLGGSLITIKNQPHTPRLDVLDRLAHEISEARSQDPNLQVLLGHGSGSFGHYPASQYQTRAGVKTNEEWQGFIEVWRQAAELNHLVMQSLEKFGLPALALPPSATVTAQSGKIASWDLEPLRAALENGLLPVIYGDAVFDRQLGGTILSTEDLFTYLASHLRPGRLLFAGMEPGVWEDYPDNTHLLSEITAASFKQVGAGLKGSAAKDVTGGMVDKVRQVIAMVETVPGLRAFIFSGEVPGNVQRALLGEGQGTLIQRG